MKLVNVFEYALCNTQPLNEKDMQEVKIKYPTKVKVVFKDDTTKIVNVNDSFELKFLLQFNPIKAYFVVDKDV